MIQEDVVTVSGRAATGTTTLVDGLEERFDVETLSGGDIFRGMAEEEGMSLATFSEYIEDKPEYDREVDSRLASRMESWSSDTTTLVVDSRLAGWHAHRKLDSSNYISIWLNAPIEERVQRIDGRDETVEELRLREESNAKRYMNFYGIDIQDLSIYDMVLRTDTLSRTSVLSVVHEALVRS